MWTRVPPRVVHVHVLVWVTGRSPANTLSFRRGFVGGRSMLQVVLMACPSQASTLPGSHSVSCDILAVDGLWTSFRLAAEQAKTKRYLQWYEKRPKLNAVDLFCCRPHITALFCSIYQGRVWPTHCSWRLVREVAQICVRLPWRGFTALIFVFTRQNVDHARVATILRCAGVSEA